MPRRNPRTGRFIKSKGRKTSRRKTRKTSRRRRR